jgi:Holliday junction resolvase RusA-like endonuclease
MNRVKVKALTVNRAWRGRRFKTPEYKTYEKEVMFNLPPKITIPEGEICLSITVGFSNKMSDIDNAAKPFIDILQKRYKFNDRDVYKLIMNKRIVAKGDEYIDFDIKILTKER